MAKKNIDWEKVHKKLESHLPDKLKDAFTSEQLDLVVQATKDFIENEQIGPVSQDPKKCVFQAIDFVIQNLEEAYDQCVPQTGMMMQLNTLCFKNKWDMDNIKAYAGLHGYHQIKEKKNHLFPSRGEERLAA